MLTSLPAVKYLKTSMKIDYWKLFIIYLDLKALLTLYFNYSVLTQKPKLILKLSTCSYVAVTITNHKTLSR